MRRREKKKKRVWFLPLLLLLLSAAGWLGWQLLGSPFPNVAAIHIYDENRQLLTTLAADTSPSQLNQVIELVKQADKTTGDTGLTPSHWLELDTGRKIDTYAAQIDFTHWTLLLEKASGNTQYMVQGEAVKQYLSLEGLEPLYPEYAPPALELALDNAPLSLSARTFEWQLVKEDSSLFSRSWEEEARPEAALEADTEQDALPELFLETNEPLALSFSRQPELLTLEIYRGDSVIATEQVQDLLIHPLAENGPLTYRLTARYGQAGTFSGFGTAQYAFSVKQELPPVVIAQSTVQSPGGWFVFQVKNLTGQEELTVEQSLSNQVLRYDLEQETIFILPLDYWATAGTYPVTIDAGSTRLYEEKLTVESRSFQVQQLTVDPNVEASTRSDEAYAQYAKYFTPVRNTSEPVPLWEGSFILPVEGRRTTQYGMRRYVNGSPTSYRHSGIDLAAPTGTPVQASNTGKVAFSMNLILTGETIILDHGLGFFTVYLHLDQRNVEAGEWVTKGDIIGTVGSTGFSTGPHLHWTASHYLKNIDPDLLMAWPGLAFEQD